MADEPPASGVTIKLRQLGRFGAPKELCVSSEDAGDASKLIARVAAAVDLQDAARLRLVHRGRALRGGRPLPGKLQDGDALTFAVAPKAPLESHRARVDGGFEEMEARDLQFSIDKLPASQQGIARFLRHRLKFPDPILIVIFALSPRGYAMIALWYAGARVAALVEFGPVYILCSIVAAIFLNLGERRTGEASAYSIFNEFQALPGQLTPEMIERSIRSGM